MARLKWSGSLAAAEEHEQAVRNHPPKKKQPKNKNTTVSKKPRKKSKKQKRLDKLLKKKVQKQPAPAVWGWKDLGFKTYREYLRSNIWRKTRNRKLRSVGWKCERCGKGGRLEVHHIHYRTVGREHNDDLEVLCGGCHDLQHEIDSQCDSHLRSINNPA